MNLQDETQIFAPDFENRCVALFDRIDSGERLTLEQAAAAVGLSADAFARLWIGFNILLAVEQAHDGAKH